MSAPCYVDGFAFALGGRRLSVRDSVAAGRTRTGAAEFLDAGFRHHHVCGDDETGYDLARAAVAGIPAGPAPVQALVYATCIPANANLSPAARFAQSRDVKHLMDFPASRLQADLGLDGAIVVGLNQQACTGMLGALRVAHGLVATDPDIRRVLCVSADRFPVGACYEQAYSLISDGAAACVVSRAPAAYRLVAAHHITNGGMADADDDATVGAYFGYTHRLVTELLAKARLSPGALDWVVPQNTNVKAWQILARLLGVDAEKVFCASLPDVAHVISADNVVNLAYLGERGLVQTGHKLLLVMAGYGMNWQALILEKT